MKRKRKYTLGGQLLQTGVSFIPGVGQILAPLVGLVDQQIEADKLAAEQAKLNQPPIKLTANPFGSFKNGGILNDGFKQYNTGSHSQGKDLAVDAQGEPDPNAANYIQNKENSYNIEGQQYVFSDTLGGKEKFSTQAKKINDKYPDARLKLDVRNALDIEMKLLSKENDIARYKAEVKASKQPTQFNWGGNLYNKAINDASNYWKGNQYPLVGQDQVPAGGNMFTSNMQELSLNVPPAQGNMFIDNSRPPLAIDPIKPIMVAPEYQGIEMAMDTTQMPPGATEIKLGQNLNDVITPQLNTTASPRGGLDVSTAGNAIGLGLKGLALAGSIKDSLSPAEKERLILPDYSKSDQYMQSANVDYTQAKQDAIGVSNIGAGTNRSLAGNAAQFQGREQARLANLQDALGRINMQEGNAQSQLNLTRGQYEANKAVDNANRTYQNQQGNMQNDAAARGFGRQLQSDLSQIGSSFNQYAETTKLNQNTQDIAKFTNSQIMATINAKNPNFKLQDDIVENFISGKTSLDDVLAFVPAGSKEEVKKILTEQKLKVK